MELNSLSSEYKQLLEQLLNKVASSRYQAARYVNKELILLYRYIGTEILNRQNEYGWGAKVIDQLSRDLRTAFPETKGFSVRNLKYMKKFAEEYTDFEFVQQVVAQLPWGHNIFLLDLVPNKDIRLFYIRKAIENG